MTPKEIQHIEEAIDFLKSLENQLNNPGIIISKEFQDKILSIKNNLTKLLDEYL